MAEKKSPEHLIVEYRFFHWGPFLYKTALSKEIIDKIKTLYSKRGKDYRNNLAGLIKHEYAIDGKQMFPILLPYLTSYAKAHTNYSGKKIIEDKRIELRECWVNYMTKFESNPIHIHGADLSFVLYTQIPSGLKQEVKETKTSGPLPGNINFIINLEHHKDKKFVGEHSFQPEVGDFFIFPSTLHHYVSHFQSEGERISISGNLYIDG